MSDSTTTGTQGSYKEKPCSSSASVAAQDALVGATDKKNSQHEKDGELFYDYEVTGAVSMLTVKYMLLLVLRPVSCWPYCQVQHYHATGKAAASQ